MERGSYLRFPSENMAEVGIVELLIEKTEIASRKNVLGRK
jgi:hypothetical protein